MHRTGSVVDPHDTCVIIRAAYGQPHRGLTESQRVIFQTRPQALDHGLSLEEQEAKGWGSVVDIYGHTEQEVLTFFHQRSHCLEHVESLAAASESVNNTSGAMQDDKTWKLVDNGPSGNRIDLVFMGDGYTRSEEDRFLQDMRRLVADMFSSTTFASHLPLFNIWALYRPSAESGVGVGGKPKDTAFGLYRDGTELRGLYTSKPQAARDACRQVGPDACDFPTLIGNDDYYGGLGGEFTISTRSPTSGTIVLRHELGHNLISVGEEYDGGTAYFGVNYARSLSAIGWRHWLTEPSPALVAQESKLLIQEHAWYNLSRAPFEKKFNTDGKYSRWLLTFSISGAPTPDSVKITLDDKEIPYQSAGTLDRTFTSIFSNEGLTRGPHALKFTEGRSPTGDILLQLCNYEVTEFMDEKHYRTDPSYIGAYNTYRLGGTLIGYRPDHERCLMRNMSSADFCVVCLEGMWMNLLSRMSLIDSVDVTQADDSVRVVLQAVPLGQLRTDGKKADERYEVTWTHNGSEQPQLRDKFDWGLPLDSARGQWSVKLHFVTPEVRSDPKGYTTDRKSVV